MHTHEPQKSKYDTALDLYSPAPGEEQLSRQTRALLDEHLRENDTRDVRRQLLHCTDLTSLRTEDTEESILAMTERVNKFVDEYGDLDNVAALCVYPALVKIVADSLEADGVEVAAVSGGFPHSQTLPSKPGCCATRRSSGKPPSWPSTPAPTSSRPPPANSPARQAPRRKRPA